MRIGIIFLYLLVAITLTAQNRNPFSSLQYDRVIFYDFGEEAEKGGLIINEEGNFVRNILHQVRLDDATIKTLNAKLGLKKSYGNGTAACFDPHCGFVYFLRNKPVAQISICLGCNRLYSTKKIPAQKQGKHGKGKEAYYTLNGMSKSFRKYLNGLLIRYKFGQQLKPGSHFDE